MFGKMRQMFVSSHNDDGDNCDTCHGEFVSGTDPLHRLDGRAREDIEEAINTLTSRLAYLGHVAGGGR